MTLRLDPRLPVLWRDPTTLQIGAERPAVVLRDVTTDDELVVSALIAGHGRSGLPPLVARLDRPSHEVAALIDVLAPALVPPPPAGSTTNPPRVDVAGHGSLADDLGAILASAGAVVRRVSEADDPRLHPVDLGVVVASHVVDPVVTAAWLRSDVPHLLVVLGDRSLRVGPVVVPGGTACARCLDLQRTDADAAWPALAAQLLRAPTVEPGLLLARDVATTAAMRVLAQLGLADRPERPEVVTRIDRATTALSRGWSRLHPACGCAVLPGTDSVDVRRPSPARLAPTTDGAALVPA